MLNENGKLIITRSLGDGIGPLISKEASSLIEAALATTTGEITGITWEDHPGGFEGFKAFGKPVPDSLVESWDRTKILLKGPWYTPMDGLSPYGEKLSSSYSSGNVAARKLKNLEIIIRPVAETSILRQGTEGFYTAAELYLTDQNRRALEAACQIGDADLQKAFSTILSKYQPDEVVAVSLATVSERCSATLARRAFALASAKSSATGTPVKVYLVTKRNIFQKSHQLMADVFARINADEFPGVVLENLLVDSGLAQMIRRPGDYEVIATENLFGDILSDGYPELYDGTNMNELPSANIGSEYSMFEPTHGIGGGFSQWSQLVEQRLANPNGMIQAGVMMLEHIGLNQTLEAATKIRSALAEARKLNIGTPDISTEGMTTDAYVSWLMSQF